MKPPTTHALADAGRAPIVIDSTAASRAWSPSKTSWRRGRSLSEPTNTTATTPIGQKKSCQASGVPSRYPISELGGTARRRSKTRRQRLGNRRPPAPPSGRFPLPGDRRPAYKRHDDGEAPPESPRSCAASAPSQHLTYPRRRPRTTMRFPSTTNSWHLTPSGTRAHRVAPNATGSAHAGSRPRPLRPRTRPGLKA